MFASKKAIGAATTRVACEALDTIHVVGEQVVLERGLENCRPRTQVS